MIRKILVPQERKLVLELPEAFIGKEVEVLAFEVSFEESKPHLKSRDQLKQELKDITVTDSTFKFDRNEANDYE